MFYSTLRRVVLWVLASTSAESTTAISGSIFLTNIGKIYQTARHHIAHDYLKERMKERKMCNEGGYKEGSLKIYLYNRYDLLTACLILLSEKF
jgi:hypothetical protein